MKSLGQTGLSAAALIGSTLLGPATALAQASKQEYPIPRNPSEDLTAIERIFTPPKPAPLTAFPELRDRWKDTPAFLRDSKLSIDARSYFRDAVTTARSCRFGTGSGLFRHWTSAKSARPMAG